MQMPLKSPKIRLVDRTDTTWAAVKAGSYIGFYLISAIAGFGWELKMALLKLVLDSDIQQTDAFFC